MGPLPIVQPTAAADRKSAAGQPAARPLLPLLKAALIGAAFALLLAAGTYAVLSLSR